MGSAHDDALWYSQKSGAGGTATYLPGVTTSTYEVCGGQVRWSDGRLEQLWHVHHIGTTGAIEKIAEEWRAVPVYKLDPLDGPR